MYFLGVLENMQDVCGDRLSFSYKIFHVCVCFNLVQSTAVSWLVMLHEWEMEGDRCDLFSASSGMRVLPLQFIPCGFYPTPCSKRRFLGVVELVFPVNIHYLLAASCCASHWEAMAVPLSSASWGQLWELQAVLGGCGALQALSSSGSSSCPHLHPDRFGQPF